MKPHLIYSLSYIRTCSTGTSFPPNQVLIVVIHDRVTLRACRSNSSGDHQISSPVCNQKLSISVLTRSLAKCKLQTSGSDASALEYRQGHACAAGNLPHSEQFFEHRTTGLSLLKMYMTPGRPLQITLLLWVSLHIENMFSISKHRAGSTVNRQFHTIEAGKKLHCMSTANTGLMKA